MTFDPRTTAESTLHLEWAEVPDAELVLRAREGDPGPFEMLMRRYNQRLFRVSRAIIGDAAEAEDVMQEAYVRAYTRLDELRGADRFAGWVTRIAVNEARARLRDRRRRQRLAVAAENLVVMTPGREPRARDNPERVAHNHELRQALAAAVDALAVGQRAVWVLRDVEGLSTVDVAACLSISEGSVRVRLHRARAALRSELLRRLDSCRADVFRFLGARCDRVVSRVLVRLPLDRAYRSTVPTDEREHPCTERMVDVPLHRPTD